MRTQPVEWRPIDVCVIVPSPDVPLREVLAAIPDDVKSSSDAFDGVDVYVQDDYLVTLHFD